MRLPKRAMRPLFSLATVTLLALAGCKKPPADAREATPKAELALPPVKVETAEVNHEQMPKYLTLTGSVLADRQSEVAAKTTGVSKRVPDTGGE